MAAATETYADKSKAIRAILVIGFIAAALDILAAFFVYSFIMNVVTPSRILQGIAAGVFGKKIIGNEVVMSMIGLLFHFIIAYGFTLGYFLIYPYVKLLQRNSIVSGIFYGIFVWLIMNLIVLPLSNAYHAPFSLMPALRSVLILILCVGLPISIFTSNYYKLL